MSRVQLAINVADLDRAVDFYSRLFATAPAKVRPGYANFAVADPPLKLVLIEDGAGAPGSLNHLGVEVERPEHVATAGARLAGAGLDTATEEHVTCCYSVQDKVWVRAPDGEPWEIYTVLSSAEGPTEGPPDEAAGPSTCCTSRVELAPAGGRAGG